MVKKLAIIREIFKGDHNAAAVARKLTRNQGRLIKYSHVPQSYIFNFMDPRPSSKRHTVKNSSFKSQGTRLLLPNQELQITG